MEFTKDMIIGDVIDRVPETANILMAHGMHCLGCPVSRMESLEQAAAVHGLNLDALMQALNNMR